MPRFSILHPLYMSFYSRELYRDVAANWRGKVFVYLFLLLALCWLPVIGVMKSTVTSYITYESPKLVGQFPEITIANGKATVDAVMPYTINDPDTGKPLAILDTTGKVTSLKGSEAAVLLTGDQLILKMSDAETRSYSLKDAGEVKINQDQIRAWMKTFDDGFVFLVYPAMLFISYVYRVLQVLLFAFIGKMYNKSLGAGLDYGGLVRISVMAVTPCIILNTVYMSLKTPISAWGLICFIISVGYLYFGVAANAPKTASGGER